MKETKNETKTEAVQEGFELSDGTKVTFEKATTMLLLKARKMAGKDQFKVPYICISEMARFNGEKRTIEEIQQTDLSDGFMLEDKWNEFVEPKKRNGQATGQ